MNEFLRWFFLFIHMYCPHMPLEEKCLVPFAIWEGSGHDIETAEIFTTTCDLESGLKVRKWFPDQKQNMDLAGAHNDCLFLELRREGLITDSKNWRKNQQWLAWRKLFQDRPDIGTLIACRAFTRLKNKTDLKRTIQGWKCKSGTVPGLLRYMQVKCIVQDMNELYRQTYGGKNFWRL